MPQKLSSCFHDSAYARRSERSRREGDYAYARNRAWNPRYGNRRLERGYEVAKHFAQVIAARSRNQEPDLACEFAESAEKWKDETGHLSSLTKALAHPSYLRIIGLSRYSTDHQLERLLLRELMAEPDHWFAALTAITGEDPVKSEDDFDAAVERWLSWGREKGII